MKKITKGKNAEEIERLKIELSNLKKEIYDLKCFATSGETKQTLWGDLVFKKTYSK